MWEIILTVICILASIFIVNGALRLLMRITGSDMMFFSLKRKVTAYAVCAVLLMALLGVF